VSELKKSEHPPPNKKSSKNGTSPNLSNKNKKDQLIFVPVTEQEKKEWAGEAAKVNLKLAQFVRSCVWFRLHPNLMGGIQGTNANAFQDQEELWDRFKELHEKIDTLMLTRDAIEQQIEEIRIDDRSLEDRIKANLLGRKLNLSELSEYCKEDSTIVLKCLKQMQEAKDVKQDQRLRWYLLD